MLGEKKTMIADLIQFLKLCVYLSFIFAFCGFKIEGQLREKGTRNPLALINVYCFVGSEKPIKATTAKDGSFTVDVSGEIPGGESATAKIKWVISASGYQHFEKIEELGGASGTMGANLQRMFYLEKMSYTTYETTVFGQQEKRDEKTKSLDQTQFLTVPGANGDPVKAVQNLPGVNRASAFSSQIIIEGSSPNDTRYNVDNQNVPLIFHFGGISSIILPEAIDHVDYLSAGFGPEFGQSIAGLVNLAVKDPKTDRLHGFAYVDLLNTGGMLEGPISDHSSFLFGLRQSYIGVVLRKALKKNSNFDFTAAPDFRDTVLEYKNTLSSQDTFRLVGIGSQDTLGFLIKQPSGNDGAIRGSLDQETDFVRLIPEWTHKFNTDAVGRASFGIGKDWMRFDLGDYFQRAQQIDLTGRIELEDQLNSVWKSYWGIDSQFYKANINFQLPVVSNGGGVFGGTGAASTRYVLNQYTSDMSGFYWRNVLHAEDSRWTWIPGGRVSYFNITNEFIPEPRLAAKFAPGSGWTLRAATGLYNEAPPIQDFDSNYGNPKLKSQRAIHGSMGFEKDFRDGAATGWTLSNDFFYKYLYRLITNSSAYLTPSQPEYYNNSAFGHVYGTEALAKYKTESWEGWVAYTFSRSTRGDSQIHETLSQYDQTHILTAVGDTELGRNWKFSARVRYTSGNPYTPINGAILDVNNDSYTPNRGQVYSQQMDPFFQTDVRFDKKWIYDTWILSLYLDVENVTNRKNPQQITYNFDYSQKAVATGLPILPTLGVKGEF